MTGTVQQTSFETLRRIFADLGIDSHHFDWLKQIHSRKYKHSPKGYPTPETITKLLIAHSVAGTEAEEVKASLLVASGFLTVREYPWYFLDRGLARDLSLTRCPEAIPDKIVLPPIGLIILPDDALEVQDGVSVQFIGYRLIQPYEKVEMDVGRHEKGKGIEYKKALLDRQTPENCFNLMWFSPDNFGGFAGGNLGLRPHDGCLELVAEDLKEVLTPKPENLTTVKIFSLLLNCLIYSSAVSLSVPTQKKSTQGFSRSSATTYEPLWLGKDYQRVREPVSGGGTKKAIHWRRGHWKRVALGVGREQRDWRWIRPTIVGIGERD